MKKILFITFMMIRVGHAQTDAMKQLEMDIQKLAALKSMLSEMTRGYQILSKGYDNIRNISLSNYNLHKNFLDGFLLVSPVVRQYKKVADIITAQAALVAEYKKTNSKLKASGYLTNDELSYMDRVFDHLLDESLKGLDELSTVMTDGKVRMNDAERLKTIDKIDAEMQDKIEFLKSFDNDSKMLVLQRAKEHNDINVVKQLYGLK